MFFTIGKIYNHNHYGPLKYQGTIQDADGTGLAFTTHQSNRVIVRPRELSETMESWDTSIGIFHNSTA